MTSFTVQSPIDGQVLFEREFATTDQIEQAMASAQEAQQSWAKRGLVDKAQYCERFVCAMEARADKIAEDIARQMGRPAHQAKGEVAGMAQRARTMMGLAEQALAPIAVPGAPGKERWLQRDPKGVVLVIAPWNYPLLTAVNVIIPALMAGNTVILKHARQTALCAEHFAQAFQMAELPEGVFQALHVDYQGTQQLIDAGVNVVTFTGSVAGGKAIQKACMNSFANVSLELGGKDPAYVRHDANLDTVLPSIVDGAFYNAGQSCCGVERLYVHESLYEQALLKVVALVQEYRLGDPLDRQTTLGPMVNAQSADKVREAIRQAMDDGAKTWIDPALFPLAVPGSPYCAPQVLSDLRHDMPIVQEETFGPLLTIMPVSDDAQAIAWMNDSAYGLTASVWTNDLSAAKAIGQRVQTGTFLVNQCDTVDPQLAWCGVKDTGRGASLSTMGYEGLTQPKSFSIKETV